jgi:hypothetical protein
MVQVLQETEVTLLTRAELFSKPRVVVEEPMLQATDYPVSMAVEDHREKL